MQTEGKKITKWEHVLISLVLSSLDNFFLFSDCCLDSEMWYFDREPDNGSTHTTFAIFSTILSTCPYIKYLLCLQNFFPKIYWLYFISNFLTLMLKSENTFWALYWGKNWFWSYRRHGLFLHVGGKFLSFGCISGS